MEAWCRTWVEAAWGHSAAGQDGLVGPSREHQAGGAGAGRKVRVDVQQVRAGDLADVRHGRGQREQLHVENREGC